MTDDPTTPTRSRVIGVDVAGTAVFLVALIIAVPFRSDRFAQFLIGGVSMVLFAIGMATTLWAYARALERSRTEEVGVANLYLLTGPTAPKPVRRIMTWALAIQVVAAVVGAWIGVVGLDKGELNALAFGSTTSSHVLSTTMNCDMPAMNLTVSLISLSSGPGKSKITGIFPRSCRATARRSSTRFRRGRKRPRMSTTRFAPALIKLATDPCSSTTSS